MDSSRKQMEARMSGQPMRVTCCICGKGIEGNDPDWYSLQVRKFAVKSPEMIWAHGPCLRNVAPVLSVELP
jgi:hypothetical protein